jgi:hypothetical protein
MTWWKRPLETVAAVWSAVEKRMVKRVKTSMMDTIH